MQPDVNQTVNCDPAQWLLWGWAADQAYPCFGGNLRYLPRKDYSALSSQIHTQKKEKNNSAWSPVQVLGPAPSVAAASARVRLRSWRRDAGLEWGRCPSLRTAVPSEGMGEPNQRRLRLERRDLLTWEPQQRPLIIPMFIEYRWSCVDQPVLVQGCPELVLPERPAVRPAPHQTAPKGFGYIDKKMGRDLGPGLPAHQEALPEPPTSIWVRLHHLFAVIRLVMAQDACYEFPAVQIGARLTAISHLPLPVHRRQEAVLGDNKLGMAAVGRRQLYVKGASLKRGPRTPVEVNTHARLRPEAAAQASTRPLAGVFVHPNDASAGVWGSDGNTTEPWGSNDTSQGLLVGRIKRRVYLSTDQCADDGVPGTLQLVVVVGEELAVAHLQPLPFPGPLTPAVRGGTGALVSPPIPPLGTDSENDKQMCRHVYLFIIVSTQRGASSSPHTRPAATLCLVITSCVICLHLLAFCIVDLSCEIPGKKPERVTCAIQPAAVTVGGYSLSAWGRPMACFGAPGKSLTSVEIPQPGGAVVGGRHGQTVVQRVALQDVYLSLMPYQALHLQPRVGVPHPDGVITD
ncbi:MAG: hypothetical protein FRX49_07181 [Trebouxia sp. A1-2]|nr:MAG: hypothetical protein FRX49_07181 [Trebouxia sp. A1-2]